MNYKDLFIHEYMVAGFKSSNFFLPKSKSKISFLTHKLNNKIYKESIWRNSIITNSNIGKIIEFKNIPTKGFKLYQNTDIDKGEYDWDYNSSNLIIIDPRGFEIEIDASNASFIFKHTTMKDNNEIDGEFVYVHTTMDDYLLIPTNSIFYKEIIKYHDLIKNCNDFKLKDLIVGHIYTMSDLNENIYLGRFNNYIKHNYYKENDKIKGKIDVFCEKYTDLFFFNYKTNSIKTYKLKDIKQHSNKKDDNLNKYLDILFKKDLMHPFVIKEKIYITNKNILKDLLYLHIEEINKYNYTVDSSFILLKNDNEIAYKISIEKNIIEDFYFEDVNDIQLYVNKEITEEIIKDKSFVVFNLYLKELIIEGLKKERTINEYIKKRYEINYLEFNRFENENLETNFLNKIDKIKLTKEMIDKIVDLNWEELKDFLQSTYYLTYVEEHKENEIQNLNKESFIQVNQKFKE